MIVKRNMKAKRMRKLIAGSLAVLLLLQTMATTVFAAKNVNQTPSGIPWSDLNQKLEQYIEERAESTSAVSVTVFNATDDLASSVYGEINETDSIQADESSVYEWGSISKMLIWVSVMQLWEQGKIDLNADIQTYLPEDFLTNVTCDEPITMLHLMNHNAGFQETTWDVEVKNPAEIISLKEALLQTAPPQIHKPGEVVSYSNWGAALAAYIVECISGVDYAEYVQKNIFLPLGMEQTSIKPDCSDNPWVEEQRKNSHAYLNVVGNYEDYGECRHYILLYPVGSATGTTGDLVRFAKAFLTNGSTCPLFEKDDTLSVMLSPSLFYGDSEIPRFCHGLLSMQYGVTLIGHPGNTAGFSSNLMLDLESGTGVVIMTNEVGETSYNYGLLSLIFGDCKTEKDFVYDDLSGIFQMSRSDYEIGFLKCMGILGGLLPLVKNGTEGSYKVLLMDGAVVTQISENTCILDDGNGTRNFMFIKRNADGNVTALQNMAGTDNIKTNAITFTLKLISIILLLLSVLWMLVMSIVHIVTIRKYRQYPLLHMKRYQLLSELLVVIVGVLIFLLVLGDSFSRNQAIWKCVLIGAGSLLEVVLLVCRYINFQRVDVKKAWKEGKLRQKIGFIMTDVSGLLMLICTCYWQFYRFWGC